MNMAQCVATDSTCPIRDKNIETIRTMVREAGSAKVEIKSFRFQIGEAKAGAPIREPPILNLKS